jgi:hypothetical protein
MVVVLLIAAASVLVFLIITGSDGQSGTKLR